MDGYEERHLLNYDTGSVTRTEMMSYLRSIGLGEHIVHPNNDGAMVVRIPQASKDLVEKIREHFGAKININQDPLPTTIRTP